MQFNGTKTDEQALGNLFVALAGHQTLHNLALPARQGGDTLSCLFSKINTTTALGFTAQAQMDALQQVFAVDRFFYKITGTVFHSSNRSRHIGMSGNNDDRYFHLTLG